MILFKASIIRWLLTTLLTLGPLIGYGAVTGRAILLGTGSNIPKTVVLVAGKKQIEIQLPRRNLSAEFTLPPKILKAIVLPKALKPDEVINPAAPTIRIPEKCSRVLLLFFPDPKNKYLPVKVKVIDASAGKFPAGHSMLYNLTRGNVAANLGGKKIRIPPNLSARVNAPRSKNGGYPVTISHKSDRDNTWKVICSSTWMHNTKARQLIFVVPTPGRTVPRVWSVFDLPQVSKKSEKKPQN